MLNAASAEIWRQQDAAEFVQASFGGQSMCSLINTALRAVLLGADRTPRAKCSGNAAGWRQQGPCCLHEQLIKLGCGDLPTSQAPPPPFSSLPQTLLKFNMTCSHCFKAQRTHELLSPVPGGGKTARKLWPKESEARGLY